MSYGALMVSQTGRITVRFEKGELELIAKFLAKGDCKTVSELFRKAVIKFIEDKIGPRKGTEVLVKLAERDFNIIDDLVKAKCYDTHADAVKEFVRSYLTNDRIKEIIQKLEAAAALEQKVPRKAEYEEEYLHR